jgi:probable HAF family extracellular repeat protein
VFTNLDPVLGVNILSMAAAINNSGQIAGSTSIFNKFLGGYDAYLYSNGVMVDLGTLGGTQSFGYGINSSGQVTGAAGTVFQNPALFPCYVFQIGSICHAFIYNNGVMTNLGTLPGGQNSAGLGINDAGQVVGYSTTTPSGSVRGAFVYTNGVMTDLNSVLLTSLPSGFTLTDADAINNAGQIVANASTGSGQEEAFLLTPVAVPEPSTLAVGVVGLCVLAAARRSRRANIAQ